METMFGVVLISFFERSEEAEIMYYKDGIHQSYASNYHAPYFGEAFTKQLCVIDFILTADNHHL